MVRTSQFLALLAAITSSTAYTYHTEKDVSANLTRSKREVLPPKVGDRIGDGSMDLCKKTGFCEYYDGYPTALAESLIAKLDEKKSFLSMDRLDLPDVSQRFGGPSERSLCRSTIGISHPERSVDEKGIHRWILNSKSNPVQGFLVEYCTAPDAYERDVVRLQPGWEGRCVQSYTYRVAAIIDDNQKALYNTPVKIPSTCSFVGYATE